MTQSAWYLIGALLTRAGRFDESRSILTDARRVGPLTTPIAQAAGLAVLRLPLVPGEIAPERRGPVELAGRAAFAMSSPGQQGQAEALLKQLGREYPKEPGVHFLLGAALIDDDIDAGVAEMKKELEISPDHVAARIRLAQVSLERDDLELALAYAREAVEFEPDSSPANLTLGEVRSSRGEWPEAVRALEAARAQTPDVVRIRWALARAYAAVGRKADAERERAAMEKLKAMEQ
jgi:predicted Zn-dependent protease